MFLRSRNLMVLFVLAYGLDLLRSLADTRVNHTGVLAVKYLFRFIFGSWNLDIRSQFIIWI